MQNMSDISKKLNQQYKNISIKLNKNEELIIRKKDIEIKAYENLVLYFYKEKSIAHSHDSTYEEVYESIKYYLDTKPSYFIKKNKRNQLISILILIIFFIIFEVIKCFIGK